jgi:hypothetical protein
MESIVKELKDNQQVRTEMDKYSPVITIGTVKAFIKKMAKGDLVKEQELIDRCNKRRENAVWSNKHGTCLTADYAGKAEDMEKKREAYKNAILLIDGELVKVDGEIYKVKYTNPRVSDPIHFIPHTRGEVDFRKEDKI